MSLSYRMLNIGGLPAGLLGLEELFGHLYVEGVAPDAPETPELLLKGVRECNYIPKFAIPGYTTVLCQEYERYFRKHKSGKTTMARNYGTWHGYPREQIPWFPTISAELCTNCAACLDLCARGVYEQDEDGKIWVAEPFSCMVGCCFCKSVCETKAILMPSQDILNGFREKK